jgi:hypothetical protein
MAVVAVWVGIVSGKFPVNGKSTGNFVMLGYLPDLLSALPPVFIGVSL